MLGIMMRKLDMSRTRRTVLVFRTLSSNRADSYAGRFSLSANRTLTSIIYARVGVLRLAHYGAHMCGLCMLASVSMCSETRISLLMSHLACSHQHRCAWLAFSHCPFRSWILLIILNGSDVTTVDKHTTEQKFISFFSHINENIVQKIKTSHLLLFEPERLVNHIMASWECIKHRSFSYLRQWILLLSQSHDGTSINNYQQEITECENHDCCLQPHRSVLSASVTYDLYNYGILIVWKDMRLKFLSVQSGVTGLCRQISDFLCLYGTFKQWKLIYFSLVSFVIHKWIKLFRDI